MSEECTTGKIGYASPQAAWDVAKHIRHRNRTSVQKYRRRNTHAYKCRQCGAWHTSSTPEDRR